MLLGPITVKDPGHRCPSFSAGMQQLMPYGSKTCCPILDDKITLVWFGKQF